MFRGVQNGRVDEKHRLKLPALVRNRLLERYDSPDVFITSLDGEDVKIFPIKEWEEIERTLSDKSISGDAAAGRRKKNILFQANHYGAEESLDNQGRILVPGPLREGPGMRGEVMIQWSANHLLVLSAERYEAKRQKAALSDDDLDFADNMGL